MTSLALFGKDADGDVPEYGQLSQMTMQPHIELMRELCTQYAAGQMGWT